MSHSLCTPNRRPLRHSAQYYCEKEIAAIARRLEALYPAAILSSHQRNFRWTQIVLPVAWHFRKSLTSQLDSALSSNSLHQLQGVAEAIYDWGFGNRIPAALRQPCVA